MYRWRSGSPSGTPAGGEAPTLPESLSPTLLDMHEQAAPALKLPTPLPPPTPLQAAGGLAGRMCSAVAGWAGPWQQAPLAAVSSRLARGAVKPVVWTASSTTAAATCALDWAKAAACGSPRKGGACPPSPARPAAASPELTPVELKLQSGQAHALHIGAGATLAQLQAAVTRAGGLPPERQALVLAEDRARMPGLGRAVRRVQGGLQAARRDLRASLLAWANFILLPEAFNRELYGRGLISWAKGSAWFQGLLEAQRRAEAAAACEAAPQRTVMVQVEQLSGQVTLVEVELGARLCELRAAVEQRLGVPAEQQRVLVLERRAPGTLTHLANALLLRSLAGARLAAGAAAWAGACLLSKPEAAIPLAVQTTAGRTVTLSVAGDTSLNQIRAMLHDGKSEGQQEDLAELRVMGALPPLRAAEPGSHVIRALVS